MSDYIKRKKAVNAVADILAFIANGEFSNRFRRSDFINDAVDWFEDVKSEDVAPVRHGRWVTTDENIGGHCSNCGMECSSVEWGDDYLMKPTWNYCPNCGARMDGDEDE